jgi:ATP-dependent DNA helicase RecQ
LRGSQSQRVIDNGHASLSVYGIGKKSSAAEWRALARTLIHRGDVRQSDDGYGVLSLNEKSWEILRGTRSVEMRSTTERQDKGKTRSREEAGIDVIDHELFESLRAVRKRLATEHGVPPYVIFHDATLKRIAERKPTTREAFLTISGVGETKLARYADAFIDEVKKAHRD